MRESFFSEKPNFFNISDIERKSSGLLLNVFRQGIQNCNLRAHSNILSILFLLERNSFLLSRKLSENFSASSQKLSPGSSELVSFSESRISLSGKVFFKTFFCKRFRTLSGTMRAYCRNSLEVEVVTALHVSNAIVGRKTNF